MHHVLQEHVGNDIKEEITVVCLIFEAALQLVRSHG